MRWPVDQQKLAEMMRLLDRRQFMSILGRGLAFTALGGPLAACSGGGAGSDRSNPSQEPPDPVSNSLPIASSELTVLKRTSFGPRRAELDAIIASDISTYLEEQLDYTNIDDGSLEADLQALCPHYYQNPAQLINDFPDNISEIVVDTTRSTLFRQLFSRRQLYEVMVEFWNDHFNIQLLNGLGPTLKPLDDRSVIRAHALGNFGDLLRASAESPSMLFYLDNFDNKVTAPNENYARELMELHTLGVDGGYTENDIKEVARCFTGWRIRFPGESGGDYGEFLFDESIHDTNSKIVLGQTISAGGGKSDGDQVLNILIAHPATAQFIATKLYQRFISDNPNQSAVDLIASAFTLSNGDIKTTLRALFASNDFLNVRDEKVTRPAEYIAGMVRALVPEGTYPTDEGELFYFALSMLGQIPHNWPTPDGYPDEKSYWASTGGMLNRWRLSFLTLINDIPELDQFSIDYTRMLDGANTIASIVDRLTEQILMRPLSDNDRILLLNDLVSTYSDDLTTLTENTVIPAGPSEGVASYVAAVLISSTYFHLR